MKELDVKEFEQVIQAEQPVVVDFWAPWCMPCRVLAPVLEELSDEMDGKADFCKINIDDYTEVAQQYSVETIPTLIVFKKGQAVDRSSGVRPKQEIEQLVQKHI